MGVPIATVACGFLACRSAVGPLPPGAERFEPPAIYSRWWEMTEACAERSSELTAVRWYGVPGSAVKLDGHVVTGYWGSHGNRIVLAEEHLDHGAAVRHEMLHAILQSAGHSRAYFLDMCASIVDCGGVCVDDAGEWDPPRPDYVVLPAESLEIDSEAELLTREADGQRWLQLWISARNPRENPVIVEAPVDPVTPPTFGFDVRGPTGGISGAEVATDSSKLFFQPLETKRWLIEFRVASELSRTLIPPGTHIVRGGYARQWAPRDTVVVSP